MSTTTEKVRGSDRQRRVMVKKVGKKRKILERVKMMMRR